MRLLHYQSIRVVCTGTLLHFKLNISTAKSARILRPEEEEERNKAHESVAYLLELQVSTFMFLYPEALVYFILGTFIGGCPRS